MDELESLEQKYSGACMEKELDVVEEAIADAFHLIANSYEAKRITKSETISLSPANW